jgi:molybdate transport system substrate-binding protein
VVKDRLAPAADVRGALALVVSDPEILGLVYRTDAATSDQVRILLEIPEAVDAVPEPQPGTAPPIRYGGAVVASSSRLEASRSYLDFLQGPKAAASFEARGFGVLGKDADD